MRACALLPTSLWVQWVYEDPAAVQNLEDTVQQLLTKLDQQAAAKRVVLQDDLAREQLREKVSNS